MLSMDESGQAGSWLLAHEFIVIEHIERPSPNKPPGAQATAARNDYGYEFNNSRFFAAKGLRYFARGTAS